MNTLQYIIIWISSLMCIMTICIAPSCKAHTRPEDDIVKELKPAMPSILETFASNISKTRSKRAILRCQRPSLRNGRVRIKNRRTTAFYKCMKHFVLLGEKTATCSGGQWSSPPPVCAKRGCSSLRLAWPVQVRYLHQQAVAEFSCPLGYTRNGSAIIYCDSVSWIGRPATCIRDPTTTASTSTAATKTTTTTETTTETPTTTPVTTTTAATKSAQHPTTTTESITPTTTAPGEDTTMAPMWPTSPPWMMPDGTDPEPSQDAILEETSIDPYLVLEGIATEAGVERSTGIPAVNTMKTAIEPMSTSKMPIDMYTDPEWIGGSTEKPNMPTAKAREEDTDHRTTEGQPERITLGKHATTYDNYLDLTPYKDSDDGLTSEWYVNMIRSTGVPVIGGVDSSQGGKSSSQVEEPSTKQFRSKWTTPSAKKLNSKPTKQTYIPHNTFRYEEPKVHAITPLPSARSYITSVDEDSHAKPGSSTTSDKDEPGRGGLFAGLVTAAVVICLAIVVLGVWAARWLYRNRSLSYSLSKHEENDEYISVPYRDADTKESDV